MHERGKGTTLTKPAIHSEKLGSLEGYPVIVMHGWGQSLQSMHVLAELISSQYTVWNLDLPGFGSSPPPTEEADTIVYAEMLKQFMDDNNIERAHLVGHSFGGRVSIRFGARFDDRLCSIVLVDSGGLKRQLDFQGRVRRMKIKLFSNSAKILDKVFKSTFYKDWFTPKFGSRDYLNSSGIMRKVLVKSVNEDVSDDAKKVNAPTFILWGELDEETPVEMAERFNRLIAGSRLVVLPGKDHFPFFGDGAHLCAHHILGFLKGLNGGKKS